MSSVTAQGVSPPHHSNEIHAGTAIGGNLDTSTPNTIKMTGGSSGAPKAKLKQLEQMIGNLPAKEIVIGGAEAEGATLVLDEEDVRSPHKC